MNIQAGGTKLDEFLLYISEFGSTYSVIVLTETWLVNADEWIEVPGFRVTHSVRDGRKGGGVTLMYRDSLTARDLPFLNVNNDIFESVGIELSINSEKYVVIGVYRSPGNSLLFFNETCFNILESNIKNSKTIITGDFNVNLLQSSPSQLAQIFVDNFHSESTYQPV